MKQRLFAVCLTGTILLAVGVVFLPRYISRSLDLRSLNRVVLTGRDQFSYMEQSAYDLAANDEAFRSLDEGRGELTLVASFDRQEINRNEELLNGVFEQIVEGELQGMLYVSAGGADMSAALGIENIYNTLDFSDLIDSAEYYSLTYTSGEDAHVKKMLNFWLVHYTDMLSGDYYFLVNEDNYKIYYAWIYSPFTEELCSIISASQEYSGATQADMYDFLFFAADGMAGYYEADYHEEISWPRQLSFENPAAVRLYFDSQAVAAEQRPLPVGRRGLRGMGTGLQSVGAYFSPPGNR